MFVVYEQQWQNDDRTSYHRSPSDILEFAANQDPKLVRWGSHKESRVADNRRIKNLDGKLGVWRE
jgi:hypothetical protein